MMNYVWAAYALAFLIILLLIINSWHKLRRIKKHLAEFKGNE